MRELGFAGLYQSAESLLGMALHISTNRRGALLAEFENATTSASREQFKNLRLSAVRPRVERPVASG